MRVACVLIGLVVGAALLVPTAVRAESPEQEFAKGKALLAKADFEGALAAYANAVRADRQNQEYQQQHAMVRQIIRLRKRLDTEADPRRWAYLARGLHSFYVKERLYAESLAIDREIHARLANASSARMLGETMLAMNMDAEAAKMLAALGPDKATASTEALRGVALARQGKKAEAREVADRLQLPNNAGPRMLYSVARLNALAGNSDKAIGLLGRAFESMRPSQLGGFKAHAKQCSEFAGLVSTPGFAKAMQVKSKVAESGCSGGRNCAGCPNRGQCAKKQGQGQ